MRIITTLICIILMMCSSDLRSSELNPLDRDSYKRKGPAIRFSHSQGANFRISDFDLADYPFHYFYKEMVQPGLGMGLELQYQWKSGFQISGGLNYSLMGFRFKWHEDPLKQNRYTHSLEFHQLGLPLSFGYLISKGNSGIQLQAGITPAWNARIKFIENYILFRNGNRYVQADNWSNLFNRFNLSLNVSAAWRKRLNSYSELELGPEFRYSLLSDAGTEPIFSGRLAYVGIRIGILHFFK